MKLAHLPIFASLSIAVSSQLLVPQVVPFNKAGLQGHRQKPLDMPPLPPQPPAGPAVPTAPNPGGSGGSGPTSPRPETGTIILSDVMGRDRSVNIFAGFTRDFAAISNRFDDITQNSTVLAPLNSAIEALPRKPWEDSEDYRTQGADVYEGPGGQERAKENLRRFVEAHIVPVSPWPEHYKANALVGDGQIWWETTADGKQVIQPGNIEVSSVASTVANGQVWIIKGVRNYAT